MYFQDGEIYWYCMKEKMVAGAYEVVDDTHVRTVIFQSCEDRYDRSTYPWTTSEAFYLGSNRVWLNTPSPILNEGYPVELVKM